MGKEPKLSSTKKQPRRQDCSCLGVETDLASWTLVQRQWQCNVNEVNLPLLHKKAWDWVKEFSSDVLAKWIQLCLP